jgi:hypothetical protein
MLMEKSNAVNDNFGRLKELKVKSDSRATVESLVKFSVPSFSGTLTSAKLELYVSDRTIDGVEVYRTNNWEENKVT